MAGLSEQADLIVKISAQNATGAVMGQLNRQFDDLKGTVLKLGAALVSAFAIRDVVDTTRAFAHDIDTLRDALGATAEQASKWNYQARYVGTTADDLASSFQILANNIYSQADAIHKGTSDFDKLGVSVLNSAGQMRPFGDIIDDLRVKMQRLDIPTQDIIQRQLFGKGGGRLHDFLNLTDQDIRRLDEDMKAFGMTVGDDVAGAMEQQQRELNRLGFLFDMLKVKLGQILIPLFISFIPIIQRAAQAVKAWADALRAPLAVVKEVADRLRTFLADIEKFGLGDALKKLFVDAFNSIRTTLSDIGTKIDETFGKDSIAATAIKAFGVALAAMVGATVIEGLAAMVLHFGQLALALAPLLQISLAIVMIKDALDAMSGVAEKANFVLTLIGIGAGAALIAVGAVPAVIVGIGVLLGTLAYNVVTHWSQITSAVGGFFSTLGTTANKVTNDIISGAETALSRVGQVLETAISGVANFVSDLWSGFIDWLKSIPVLGSLFAGVTTQIIGGLPTGTTPSPNPTPTPTPVPAPPPPGTPQPTSGGGASTPGEIRGAAGGFIMQPTRLLAGEAGPEALIPLDRMGAMGGGQNITIVINGDVDSRERVRELAREVSSAIMQMTRAERNFSLS